jgi:hypothetical protein
VLGKPSSPVLGLVPEAKPESEVEHDERLAI